ncbi:MAG: glycosyltransferase [Synechococcales cyanobacterium RU_4_20]|nr:glycosyltransferase [Synechococcales cyanobacterium RU_4_20]
MSQSPVSQSPVLRSQAVVSVVCTRSQPYPALGGAPLRNLQTLEALKRLGPVSLFSLYKGRHEPDAYGGLANWEHCDLNLARRSFGDKLGQRLRWLRADGYYYTDWIYTAQNTDQLRRFLARVRPQVIVFEELWLCPYLTVAIAHRQAHPGCQIILDNHNVEGLLAPERRNLIPARTWADRIGLALRPQRVRRLERRALAQVDQMWVCSDADRQALVSLYGIDPGEPDGQKLRVVPNGVEVAAYKADLGRASGSSLETARSPRQQPELPLAEPKLLFLGSFGYGPNAEAAQILIDANLSPNCRQRHPTAQLSAGGQRTDAADAASGPAE